MNKVFFQYQELCTQYYELDKPTMPTDEFNLYLSYAKELSGTILEPMCGTGRLLLPLVKAGFSVEGFDASGAMLKVLQQKADAQKLSVTVWQGFVEDLALVERYAAVMIPLSSFNLITDWFSIKKSLTALYTSLQPGGLFVAEILLLPLANALEYGTEIRSEVSDNQGKTIALKTIYQQGVDEGVVGAACHYTLFEGDKKRKEEHERYELRLYSCEEITELFYQVGFTSVHLWKAFERGVKPLTGDCMIIIEARK